jgi:DNA primase catalytic core
MGKDGHRWRNMRIKNLEVVMSQIRPKLSAYLEEQGRDLSNSHFQCPNSSAHRNEDETPSCGFYPDEEHFHCFSCDAAGDIFKAVSFIEGRPTHGIEFITDNVAYLADKYSVTYEVETGQDSSVEDKGEIYKVLELTSQLLGNTLKADSEMTKSMKSYIKKRGWQELLEEFGFGWCSYDKLINKLRGKKVTNELLVRAGLLAGDDQKKKAFQRFLFEDRLVFPIRNHFGRVVAFASRDYKGDKSSVRYLNFGNTSVYTKGNVLFNLDKARTEGHKLYVVEGYADVFTLYLSGVRNVVALCGKSFSTAQYEALVKCGVRQIVFCLDNEPGAFTSLDKILHNLVVQKAEIETFVKKLDDSKDPDDFIQAHGKEKFLALPEQTIFEYQLEKYKESPEENIYKDECLAVIANEESPIGKERLIKKMSEVMGISEYSITQELYSFDSDTTKGVLLEDILLEMEKMEIAISGFEEWSWRRGELLGLHMGWPILTEKMEGLQNGLYLIGGRSNIGKSTMCLSLARNLILHNPDQVFVLYFSIDDNTNRVLPRILADYSGIEINVLSNPIHKIRNNAAFTQEQRLLLEKKRDEAVHHLRWLSNSWAIKDVGEGRSLEYMEKVIRMYKTIAKKKQLVVFIDNLHKMTSDSKGKEQREKFTYISEGLKRLINVYDIPLVATVEIRKMQDRLAWPTEEDIKETIDLVYDSDVVFMLHNEYTLIEDSAKTKLYHVTDEGVVLPIIGLWARKNKMSDFKGRSYYKFYPELARIQEVTSQERVAYDRVGEVKKGGF